MQRAMPPSSTTFRVLVARASTIHSKYAWPATTHTVKKTHVTDGLGQGVHTPASLHSVPCACPTPPRLHCCITHASNGVLRLADPCEVGRSFEEMMHHALRT